MGPVLVRPAAVADPLQEVLQRYLLTGDEEALERVVRETRPRLLAVARRIGAAQDAEDSVQSAYLSLMRHRGARLEAPVMPWLLTTVIRIAYRRKAVVRREESIARILARPMEAELAGASGPFSASSPSAPEVSAMGAEEAARLRVEVDRLPEKYRDPVVLHYLHGLPTPEAARLLDLPEATVRTRLLRARRLLRSRLPAGLLLGLLSLPWLIKDAAHGAGSAMGFAAIGGSMTTGGAVGLGLAAAAVGAFIGAKLLGGGAEDPAKRAEAVAVSVKAEHDRMETAQATALAALKKETADSSARAEKAEKETAALRTELEGLRAAAETAKAEKKWNEAGKTAAEGGPGSKEPRIEGPRFSYGEYDAALKEVDWKAVGTSTRTMLPLLGELRDSSRKGGPPPIEAIGKVQQSNGALIQAAMKIHKSLPGNGINGAFTHPAFMTNSMAATLEAAGMPLTDAQAESLSKIGHDFSDRDRARASGYDERTYGLQKLMDEAELKDRFFEQALGILGAEQRDLLSPPATRGLVSLDLYSSGLMLAQHLVPIASTDRDSFASKTEESFVARMSIPADRKADVGAAIKAWATDFPEDLFAEETEMLFGAQLTPRVATVEDLGRRLLPLLRKLVEEMGLPEETAKKLRESDFILVPMVKKGG